MSKLVNEAVGNLTETNNSISPLEAVIAIAATFIISLFLGAAFVLLLGYAFALIFGELLLIIVPLSLMLYKGIDIKTYIGFEVKAKSIFLGIISGASLLSFNIVISIVLTSILGPSQIIEEANRLIIEISNSPQGVLALMVALSLAGICEEFTFRGFLQTAIKSKYSIGVALLVSSLAFGLFHFDPQAIYTFSAFLLGLLLGYIYHRSSSYIVPAVAHATLNLIVFAISILFA